MYIKNNLDGKDIQQIIIETHYYIKYRYLMESYMDSLLIGGNLNTTIIIYLPIELERMMTSIIHINTGNMVFFI